MSDKAVARRPVAVPATHQAHLERPMTGAPMVGDPRFDDAGGNVLMRRACLYAAEMVRGKEAMPEGLSGFDAVLLPPATIAFIRADASQVEVTRFTIPQHVLAFPCRGPSPLLEIATSMSTAPTPDAERIVLALRAIRFPLSNEKTLQAAMAEALAMAGFPFEREVKLAPGSVIDFMVGGTIGIEVKIKGQKKSIFRQCERYCAVERVQALIVATNASMGFPGAIGGKPVYVLHLGKAWL